MSKLRDSKYKVLETKNTSKVPFPQVVGYAQYWMNRMCPVSIYCPVRYRITTSKAGDKEILAIAIDEKGKPVEHDHSKNVSIADYKLKVEKILGSKIG